MVGLVVEGAIGDDQIRRDVSLQFAGFLHLLLLAHHDQGQLARRLPVLILLGDFLGVEGYLPALLVVGLGALGVVDLVLLARENAQLALGFVDVVGLDVELGLGFGQHLSVLVLLEADVLLSLLFLGVLGGAFDHRLGVRSAVHLGVEASARVFLRFFVQVELGIPIEFAHSARFFVLLLIIVVDVRVLLSLQVDRFILLLRVVSINAPAQFGLPLHYAVRGQLLYEVILSDPIEVRVFQCFKGGQAVTGLHLQQLLQEIEAFWGKLAEVALVDGLKVVDFGELHAQVAWVLQEGFIVVGSQTAEALLDEKQLIELILSRKHGIPIDQFAQDAANCPDIDFLGVVGPDQQLRRTVPSRGHVVGQLLLVVALLDVPGKAKVAYFQLLPITDEQVLQFDVPVHDVQRVQVGESFQQLVNERSDQLRLQAIRRLLQHFKQVILDILKDQINDALLPEGLLQLHDIGMLDHLQDLHLSHRSLLDHLVVLCLLELLDRDDLLVVVAPALQDHAVCALADHPQNIIFLHYYYRQIGRMGDDGYGEEMQYHGLCERQFLVFSLTVKERLDCG